MCMRREELEYSMEEEVANNDAYVAPPSQSVPNELQAPSHDADVLVPGTENPFRVRFHASAGKSPNAGIFRETDSTDACRLLQRGG